jgi:hypothetical protein
MSQPSIRAPQEPQHLAEEYVVLLPVVEVAEAQRQQPLASAVARYQGGHIVVVRVVVPVEQPLSDGVLEARRVRHPALRHRPALVR